jgi:CubicO group peptidase (beta-lactamase class C family)
VSLDEVHDLLVADVTEGLFATGGQLYVSVGGEVVADWAFGVDGLGRPVAPDTLFAVYCSGKPVFAVTLGALVDDGELSWDDRLGDLVDRPLPDALAGVLVGDVLRHTAGLHELDMYTYFAASPARQRRLVEGLAPPAGWPPEQVGYGQVAGWDLLGWAVEDLTGRPVREVVQKRVLEPLDLTGDVFVGGMTDDDYARCRDRLGVNTHLSGLLAMPILAERNRRFRCADSPAAAGTACARGLGRFYDGLRAALDDAGGADGAVVARATLQAMRGVRSHGDDVVMGRRCGYGLGFMVRLAEHEFGRTCSDRSFGHSAYGGVNAAFCDPERDLVVAYHLNGRVDAESALGYRRPALVEGIYRGLFG